MVGENRFTQVFASDNAKWNSMRRNLASLHNKFIFNSAIPPLEIYLNIHRKSLKCFMQKSIPYGIICNTKIQETILMSVEKWPGCTDYGPVEGIIIMHSWRGFPGDSVVKNPPANAGDAGSIPVSGRSPGAGNGHPLQSSCLGNPMDRGAWQLRSMGSQRVTT